MNEKYNYRAEMANDIRAWLDENCNGHIGDDLRDEIYNELWICDGVTGNASGSYTFSTCKAEEYICHNLNLIADAAREFGCGTADLSKGAEYWDVTIRCYLLGEVLSEVVEDWNGEHPEHDEDDDGCGKEG